MLNNMNYFSLGVYTTIFLYFMYLFFSYKEETFNLYFSLGCLIAISRIIITKNLLGIYSNEGLIYEVVTTLYYFSYLWGGILLMLIAESLFKEERLKYASKVFSITISIYCVVILFLEISTYTTEGVFLAYLSNNILMDVLMDTTIFLIIIYSSFIYMKAVIKKRKRAIHLCIANAVMCFGVLWDILFANKVFYSPVGEINIYTYIIYLMIFSYVLSKITKEYEISIFNSELNFLHAQIQPHFLFNTINTVIMYCREEPNTARELLLDLSTYLRGKFDYDSENMRISIKDEIELIKSYLTIEKVRFGDRLIIDYDIDDDIDIMVPCLIFQPIVENAVKHGLKDMIHGVKIEIKVKKEDYYISLQVKDNGKGIEKETLSKILRQESKGVGINNTSKRLKLYYNTDLIIESFENMGTSIIIKIPIGGTVC